jgi:hypothetical protein
MRTCHAGRKAFFNGKWSQPCLNKSIHYIVWPNGSPIELCDEHFFEVSAAGLITEPNISEKEAMRRETERIG